MKKIFALCLVLALTPSTSAYFFDVDTSYPYYDAVNYVQGQQIVQGYEDGTYRPGATINRAEFAKMIVTSLYAEEKIAKCEPVRDLKDISRADWYFQYVCMAVREGILHGYPDGTFGAGNMVNFAELSKMIVGAYDMEMVIDGPEWYRGYFNSMTKYNAWPPTVIDAGHQVTRGELAEILYRLRDVRPTWARR